MYDIGAGLEVISPLCPQNFLLVGGLANMAKVNLVGEYLRFFAPCRLKRIQNYTSKLDCSQSLGAVRVSLV
jgi:hypothetical protein